MLWQYSPHISIDLMVVNWLTCSKWSATWGIINYELLREYKIDELVELTSFAFNNWQDIPLDRLLYWLRIVSLW